VDEIDEAVRILKEAGRLKDDTVFVDVGANIGTQTVHALRAGPFTRAVAFEPEQRNAKLLNMNLAANGMAARVTVFAKADRRGLTARRACSCIRATRRACARPPAIARYRQERARAGHAARHRVARFAVAGRR
jgi:FkbM family methyltransferase